MFPNKSVAFEQSVLWLLPDIMNIVIKQNIHIEELWILLENKVQDINKFLNGLCILYMLDKIEITQSGEIVYVSRN